MLTPTRVLTPCPAACTAVLSLHRLFIWILFIAAVVSAALQAWADMGLILGVVIINVGIGLFQEGKAEKVRAQHLPCYRSSSP
jgi:magnesium-transporting ATPase (P-type)